MIVHRVCNNYTISFNSGKTKPFVLPVESLTKNNSEITNYLQNLSAIKCTTPKAMIDVPIKDDEEFFAVLERVLKAKTTKGGTMWLGIDDYKKYYPKANRVEMGLLPYCGANDNSLFINLYLSGRLNNPEIRQHWLALLPADKESFVDMVRVLDYSLKHLDNEFGKFNGIVYRQGFMAEKTEQFISTSTNPSIAGQLNNNWYQFNPSAGFSVIRTKNGHKIYDFQKKMKSDYAKSEQEVLLPRKAEYKLIKPNESNEELYNAREKLASKLFAGADWVISGKLKKFNGYTRKKLLNLVKIYDEI